VGSRDPEKQCQRNNSVLLEPKAQETERQTRTSPAKFNSSLGILTALFLHWDTVPCRVCLASTSPVTHFAWSGLLPTGGYISISDREMGKVSQ
jgi:hypothetical protein